MSIFKHKLKFKRLQVFGYNEFRKKLLYCYFQNCRSFTRGSISDLLSYSKINIIDKLVSNIYIYKFPPILIWHDNLNFDIPVDYISVMRKLLEHSSEYALNNIDELCFSVNSEYSSYGNRLIIIPFEYVICDYNKILFLENFSHEIGHALLEYILKDDLMSFKVKYWHEVIKYQSFKLNNNFFFDAGMSDLDLAKYQMEDYREFFCEIYSNILVHFRELIEHICSIEQEEVQQAYLSMLDLTRNFVFPLSKKEVDDLVSRI